MNTIDEVKIENPLALDRIISYMERTKEEKWATEVVRTGDGKDCFFGHLFNMGGNFFWEMFESMYATTYMVYPVNDGSNTNYPQASAKERCIAYLKDLRDGRQKTTQQIYDDFDEERMVELGSKKHIIGKEKPLTPSPIAGKEE